MGMQMLEKPCRIALKRSYRIGIEHRCYAAIKQFAHGIRNDPFPAPGPIASAVTRSSITLKSASTSRNMIAVTCAACSAKCRPLADYRHQPCPNRQRRLRRQPRRTGPERRPAPYHRMAAAIFVRLTSGCSQSGPQDRSVIGNIQRECHLPTPAAFACAEPKFFDSRAAMSKYYDVHIIGGGLAGCEAAWQLARRGFSVRLSEMRGSGDMTPAHQTDGLAELVCSNSFRSDDAENNAVGLLHQEMRDLGLAYHAGRRSRQGTGRIGAGRRSRYFLTNRLKASPR